MSFAISFVPKWKESEPKSIYPKSMCRARARARTSTPPPLAQTRLDAFARSLQLSADSSVIWLQKGGRGGCTLLPVSFFGARWRLWRCCWYPWCIWIDVRRRKHWMHGDAGSIQWQTQKCICCMLWRDECFANAFISVALLSCYSLSVLRCRENLPVWLFLEWSGWFLGRPGWAILSDSSASDDANAASCRPK